MVMTSQQYNRVTEEQVGIAVLQILANRPTGEATIAILQHELPDHLGLSDADRTQSITRPNEEIWEQQVRNLISHRTTEGNIIYERLADYIPDSHSIRITDAGRAHFMK